MFHITETITQSVKGKSKNQSHEQIEGQIESSPEELTGQQTTMAALYRPHREAEATCICLVFGVKPWHVLSQLEGKKEKAAAKA